MKKGNEPAFPVVDKVNLYKDSADFCEISSTEGMTKREYFAARAMQGLISSTSNMSDGVWFGIDHPADNENLAMVSCIIADALLKELEK